MKKRVLSGVAILVLLAGMVCIFSEKAQAVPINCSGAVGDVTYQCISGVNQFCAYQQVNGEMTLCLGEIEWGGITPAIPEE